MNPCLNRHSCDDFRHVYGTLERLARRHIERPGEPTARLARRCARLQPIDAICCTLSFVYKVVHRTVNNTARLPGVNMQHKTAWKGHRLVIVGVRAFWRPSLRRDELKTDDVGKNNWFFFVGVFFAVGVLFETAVGVTVGPLGRFAVGTAIARFAVGVAIALGPLGVSLPMLFLSSRAR